MDRLQEELHSCDSRRAASLPVRCRRVAHWNRVWIGEVRFSAEVEEKLWVEHGLSRTEVERALVPTQPRDAVWHDDPRFGERLIVRTRHPDSNVTLYVILSPIDEREGVWACKTARRIRR